MKSNWIDKVLRLCMALNWVQKVQESNWRELTIRPATCYIKKSFCKRKQLRILPEFWKWKKTNKKTKKKKQKEKNHDTFPMSLIFTDTLYCFPASNLVPSEGVRYILPDSPLSPYRIIYSLAQGSRTSPRRNRTTKQETKSLLECQTLWQLRRTQSCRSCLLYFRSKIWLNVNPCNSVDLKSTL